MRPAIVPAQTLMSQCRRYGVDCESCAKFATCDKVGGGEPVQWPVVEAALRARTMTKEPGRVICTIRFVRGVAALSIDVLAILLRETGGRRGV